MKKDFCILWMTCGWCETNIKNELEKEWIIVYKISHKNGLITINYSKKNLIILEKTIKKLWYKLSHKNNNYSKNKLIIALSTIMFSMIIAYLLRDIHIGKYFFQDTKTFWFGFSFFMWFVASMSTCLVVIWSIVLWFTQYLDYSKTFKQELKVQLLFQLWRILWFFLLWWFLWLLGKMMTFTGLGKMIFTTIISISIIFMWLHMMNLLPNIFNFSVKKIKISKWKNILLVFLIWFLTFFLPCWFTQTMQLLATQSGSFLDSAIMMWLFSLGTLPVLLIIWLWWKYIKTHKLSIIKKLIWIIIIVFSIQSVLNLFQIYKYHNTNTTTINQEIVYQEIYLEHNGIWIVPRKLELQAWWDYKIIITPTINWLWCMSTLMIPKINGKVSQIINWKPIEYIISNIKKWTYNIVCASMWMYQWEIIVK